MKPYICTKFHKISLTIFKLYRGEDFYKEKFQKEHNSTKSVSGVTNLIFCTLSDGGLYLYQVS